MVHPYAQRIMPRLIPANGVFSLERELFVQAYGVHYYNGIYSSRGAVAGFKHFGDNKNAQFTLHYLDAILKVAALEDPTIEQRIREQATLAFRFAVADVSGLMVVGEGETIRVTTIENASEAEWIYAVTPMMIFDWGEVRKDWSITFSNEFDDENLYESTQNGEFDLNQRFKSVGLDER